ncbi:uncharacterized protein E5676_scaffold119G001340 [Cucumis melo var. makuwa]|uniref:Uncharacterized protein n=1 Tax=Cucumis melo var. makuwa TaxID=1194695 RepID=A0A5D3D4Y0_CUCMM|nr:uncharacterized protein E6C27_scaffold548G001850 [Cucumis melo var. makuwa]TYK18603.1 uncharacterized protein E5676_scaffold119G001340 [Cucumis melo var. makuwa]
MKTVFIGEEIHSEDKPKIIKVSTGAESLENKATDTLSRVPPTVHLNHLLAPALLDLAIIQDEEEAKGMEQLVALSRILPSLSAARSRGDSPLSAASASCHHESAASPNRSLSHATVHRAPSVETESSTPARVLSSVVCPDPLSSASACPIPPSTIGQRRIVKRPSPRLSRRSNPEPDPLAASLHRVFDTLPAGLLHRKVLPLYQILVDPSCGSSAPPYSLGQNFFNIFVFLLTKVDNWAIYDILLQVFRVLMHFNWSFVLPDETLVFASSKPDLLWS